MQYRRLGRSGLQLSELSLGSWVTYHNQVDTSSATEMLAAAFDTGINFFDNAEVYASGRSEVVMGEAFKALKWPRLNYVVSTKFFWGLDREGHATNRRDTLNRKYLMIEETVWAMSDIIRQGKALYWGTSEWPAADIRAAYEIAERHHLHKPVMEQPQYHLFHRQRVEQDYARLYEDMQLGLTTWSPLASGLLTGKYLNGIPEGSRGAMESMAFLRDGLLDPVKNAAVRQLSEIAADLGGNVAQLAIAWINKNPKVSTVILGASKLSQLQDNLKALELTPKLTPEVLARIDAIAKPLAA
jgi:aryl-alcohol dehydrogenase-like predicted oxidoreductase